MKSLQIPATLLVGTLFLSFSSSSPAALIFQDQFAVPPNTVGTQPQGWTAAGVATPDDNVAAANLTYPALATGTPGSWLHDGDANQQYYRDFSGSGLAANTTIFYSFLLNIADVGTLNTTGPTSGVVALSNNSITIPGNGAVAAFSFRKDSSNPDAYNIGVATGFRGIGNNTTSIIGLSSWAATGGTAFNEGQTVLLVASYRYTSATSSTVNFWVNPSSLGGVAPTPTFSLSGTGTGAGVAAQRFLVNSIGGTSSTSSSWTLDAFRVGDTWADVTIPEPTTASLLGAGLLLFAAGRRRNR
ncbi:MAG: PEP-CTERM sorting domain-containing protein [Terrimicrobiaceae bacterium]|nr:PEP-CTERM sorting domain-containing protein [Terrimicrobiaceae bacterium]